MESSAPVSRKPSPTSNGRGLALAAFMIVIALVGGLWATQRPDRIEPGGPLVNEYWSETYLPEGADIGTFGLNFPPEMAGDIEILFVEPIEPSNVTILGMSMLNREVGIGAEASWPPAHVDELVPVEGAVVHADEIRFQQIIVGLQKIDPTQVGRVEDFKIRYRFDGRTYETNLNASLALR